MCMADTHVSSAAAPRNRRPAGSYREEQEALFSCVQHECAGDFALGTPLIQPDQAGLRCCARTGTNAPLAFQLFHDAVDCGHRERCTSATVHCFGHVTINDARRRQWRIRLRHDLNECDLDIAVGHQGA